MKKFHEKSETAANPFDPQSQLSLAASTSTAKALLQEQEMDQKQYFRSRKLKSNQAVEQPWKEEKDSREKWVTVIPLAGLALGLAVAAGLVVQGLFSIEHHKYNLVLDEAWATFDTNIWTKESNVGGFGNHEFIQATATIENVFVQNDGLHFKPTLQNEDLIMKNTTVPLSDCTGTTFFECNAVTNTTNGTIVPPVKSGRIHTKHGTSITYGRVEVTATLPRGDWLWPAIWMMPVDDAYGPWPRSGEIDIMESRGNNWTYGQGGNNIMSSALHWGPDQPNDAWWRTNSKHEALHSSFADKPHTYGLEWSQKYLYTYVDNRLLQVLYTPFKIPLWTRGRFPYADNNGTMISNPWIRGNTSAPFDQRFYLIINLAVGGTNGWFEDGKSGKPWVDTDETAPRDFWKARDIWTKTWEKGGDFVIHKVKMWQQID